MKQPRRRFRMRRAACAAAALAAAALLYAWLAERRWVDVTRHEVRLPVREALRLAHLSDLHTRGLHAPERALLSKLDEERPDAIVITGDTLCQDGVFEE